MSFELTGDYSFPKSARLLKRKDFFFRPARKIDSENFKFVIRDTDAPSSRIGISISKKVLKLSVARNRVRRLIRETFRLHKNNWNGLEVHVIAKSGLTKIWKDLKLENVKKEFLNTIES